MRNFQPLSSRRWVGALVGGAAMLGVLVAGGAIAAGALPNPVTGSGMTQTSWRAASVGAAFFKFDDPPNPETFIFELTDPVKIALARRILSGQEPPHHIMGTIVKQPAGYNPPWSFHLDPSTASFFDNGLEVCDATIQYVEDHLQAACGAFLPGCVWCPWNSRLLSEVQLPATHLIYLPLLK